MNSNYKLSPFLVLVIIFLFVFAFPISVSAEYIVTNEGNLVERSYSQVLGDKDEDEDEDENESEDRDNNKNKKEDDENEEDENISDETEDEKDEEERNEIKTNQGTQNKSENSEIKNKNEVKIMEQNENKASKIKLESEDGKLKIKALDENDNEFEFDNSNEYEDDSETEIEIEESDNKNKIKIKATEKNSYTVIRNKVAAQTNFPLQVNLDTNELIVTTPKGEKTVTVLPDQAVQNMLSSNVIDQVGGKGGLLYELNNSGNDDNGDGDYDNSDDYDDSDDYMVYDDSGEYDDSEEDDGGYDYPVETLLLEGLKSDPTIDNLVNLTASEDGVLQYEIEGTKKAKLLGFFDVDLNRKVLVSAETGEVLKIQQDFVTQLKDFFSV